MAPSIPAPLPSCHTTTSLSSRRGASTTRSNASTLLASKYSAARSIARAPDEAPSTSTSSANTAASVPAPVSPPV